MLSKNKNRKNSNLPINEEEYVINIVSMIEENALRYKISNLLTWYIDKSKSNKRWYIVLIGIATISNICIPTVNLILDGNIVKIVNSILAAITALSLSINNFMCFKDNWRKYRNAAEKIKCILVDYLINLDNLKGFDEVNKVSCQLDLKSQMIENINKVVTDENVDWYDRINKEPNMNNIADNSKK